MIQQEIVGVWALNSFESKDVETKAIERPLGENPRGHLIFTAGGHMSATCVSADRKPLSLEAPTDAERAALFRTMFAYSGKYRLQGNRVLHDVVASWRGDWDATTQTRFAELSDGRLTIKTAPFHNPRDGRLCIVTAVWGRAEQTPGFPTPNGPMRTVNKLIKRAAAVAGVNPSISAHWLRHAHASHALDRGASLADVGETLGHANVATTGIYLHARPDRSSGLKLDEGIFRLG